MTKLLGKMITEVPDLARAANPETYIRQGAPPFLIQHGTRDYIVPYQQSVYMAAKLVETLGEDRVNLDLLEGAGHGDPRFVGPENVNRVLDFLDRHLR